MSLWTTPVDPKKKTPFDTFVRSDFEKIVVDKKKHDEERLRRFKTQRPALMQLINIELD